MSHSLWDDNTPAEIKNAKGLHLITTNTPNGQKPQIMLEELKDVYGLQWTNTLLNLKTGEQKKDWFLRLNPNGRIPILIDSSRSPPYPVMESSAELLYLQELYDHNNEFGFADKLERHQALQWLFFWHGSGAPYLGQMAHFARSAKDKIPYAIERFTNESERVFNVLEIHLSGKFTGEPRDYLAGPGKGKYSIADIGSWPWVQHLKSGVYDDLFSKVKMEDLPHLIRWIDRIAKRPAVKRGIGAEYDLPK